MTKQSELQRLEQRILEVREMLNELEFAARALREDSQHEVLDSLLDTANALDEESKGIALLRDEVVKESQAFIDKLKTLLN